MAIMLLMAWLHVTTAQQNGTLAVNQAITFNDPVSVKSF